MLGSRSNHVQLATPALAVSEERRNRNSDLPFPNIRPAQRQNLTAPRARSGSEFQERCHPPWPACRSEDQRLLRPAPTSPPARMRSKPDRRRCGPSLRSGAEPPCSCDDAHRCSGDDVSEPKPTRRPRVAAHRAHVAPIRARSGHKASPAKKANTSATSAKSPRKATVARPGTKTAKVLGLLRRSGGASLKELRKATGWQAHSVRGFLAGALGQKMGLAVASTQAAGQERRYSVNG